MRFMSRAVLNYIYGRHIHWLLQRTFRRLTHVEWIEALFLLQLPNVKFVDYLCKRCFSGANTRQLLHKIQLKTLFHGI